MVNRQQILHAIISDGQKMMRANEVEDREEFQHKLQLLSEQWESVRRRSCQRRAIIEDMIAHWQQFNMLSQQLDSWLQEKEKAIKAFEFDSASLQTIRDMVEKCKVCLNFLKQELIIQDNFRLGF